MQLRVPSEIAGQLADALWQAGQREIGGILMGEHIGPDVFRVKKITLQRKGGTLVAFIRIAEGILAPLLAFFDSNRHNYRRFNYLGEWHSHHSFALVPSRQDHTTMYSMVIDEQLGARFVLLLLVKSTRRGQLDGSVTVYQPNKPPFAGRFIQECSAHQP